MSARIREQTMRAIGVAAVLMLTSAGTALADEWTIIRGDAQSITGVDRESIRTIGSRRLFWSVAVDAESNEFGVWRSFYRIELDCTAETMRFVSINAYGDGDTAIYSDDEPTEPTSIVPGTLADDLKSAVCEGQWLIEESVPDVADFVQRARSALRDQ